MTPASPWIGSRTTAATSSVTAARRAASSPYGTWVTPGRSGSNGSRYAGLWVSASAPVLRPWNAPSAATIRVRPVRRASLTAASTASVPELAKKTAEPGGAAATSSSRSASSTCAVVVKKLETCTRRAACALTASTIAGWAWPRAFTAMPASRSR